MFIALIVLYSVVGSGEFDVLYTYRFPFFIELFFFMALFFSFAIKVPVLPLHIWLPEAHVEAPTTGSVLLAGVLLKLGTYGILRILIPVFPNACITAAPFVYLIATLGIVYSSFAILRQIDLKKIIAYSSVIHMNYALIGLFSFDFNAVMGSIFLMINHGIVSSGLFFCIGMLYERYHSRLLLYYGGLNLVMPCYSLAFIIFSLANIGFPGTSSFVGEFLVLLGTFDFSFSLAIVLNITVVSSVCYML
jgi:NADH-quinone oxidoreductase subunit M